MQKGKKIAIAIIIGLLAVVYISDWGSSKKNLASAREAGVIILNATLSVEDISLSVKDEIEELEKPEDYEEHNPIASGEFSEEDWDVMQKEEALNAIAEESARDYYDDQFDYRDYDPLSDLMKEAELYV